MASTDTAKELLTLLGGPTAIFSLGSLLSYANTVLSSKQRSPRKGWTALGAGTVAFGFLAVFVVASARTVWRSLGSDGPVEPYLVLLAVAWVAALALGLYMVVRVRDVVRYLAESYHPSDEPRLVVGLRDLLHVTR